MIIDDIDISNLGDNAEEAFITFEKRLRDVLLPEQEKDMQQNTYNGDYHGSYAPQRHYVSSVIAFLDEYELEIGEDIIDISKSDNNDFSKAFSDFFGSINYARTRFKLRKEKIATGQVGTPVSISFDYKEEINKMLETIRKIVNQQIDDENKKDSIHKKLSALQLEVNSDKTTLDSLMCKFIDISEAIGECGEKLEPAVSKLERVMAAIYGGAKRTPRLPSKDRQKLLPSTEKKQELMDDEIPF